MTIEDVKSLVDEYSDLIAAKLRAEKDGKQIKEYANKLRLTGRIISAIDEGKLKLND